jgi:hypothetical protein
MTPAYWQKSYVPRQISHCWQQSDDGMITAMIVLIGIAVILLLLVVLGPVEQRPGFTQKPSTRFTDHNANGQWALR